MKQQTPATVISKMQWAEIEKNLRERVYASVKFKLQTGELIEVIKQFTAENRMGLVVYIDGKYNPVWGYPSLNQFLPLVKTVWCRKTRKPGATVARKISAVRGGKAFLRRKENAHLHTIVESWAPYFNTARALVTQFKKIDGIQLLEDAETSHD